MSAQLLTFSIEDDEAIDAMWEHSKSTSIPSLEVYVEEVPLGNQGLNVTSNPSPTPNVYAYLNLRNSFRLCLSCLAYDYYELNVAQRFL